MGCFFIGAPAEPVEGAEGGGGGCGLGPDQQHGAWGVVDDEAAGGAEAARPWVGVVAVAGQDEQVSAVGGGHDFAFGAAAAFAGGAGAAQPRRRGGQQLFGGRGGHALQRRAPAHAPL